MIIAPSFPLNMLAWSYAATVLLIFAAKNYGIYRQSNNRLHRLFAYFLLVIGSGLLVFAVPPLLTDQPQLLRITMSLADVTIMLSLLIQARICRELKLFPPGFYRIISVLIVLIAASVFILGLTFTQVQFEAYLTWQRLHPLNGALQSLVFGLTLLPAGYFFIKNGLQQGRPKARIKVAGFGLVYVVASLVSIYNYGLSRGQDSLASAVLVAIAFTGLLVIALTPSQATPSRPATAFERVGTSAID